MRKGNRWAQGFLRPSPARYQATDGKESRCTTVYLPKVRELGLHGITWHTLRHTSAPRLAMEGVAPIAIAAALRHRDISLVKRYPHHDPTYLTNEIEKASSFGRKDSLNSLVTGNTQLKEIRTALEASMGCWL